MCLVPSVHIIKVPSSYATSGWLAGWLPLVRDWPVEVKVVKTYLPYVLLMYFVGQVNRYGVSR